MSGCEGCCGCGDFNKKDIFGDFPSYAFTFTDLDDAIDVSMQELINENVRLAEERDALMRALVMLLKE